MRSSIEMQKLTPSGPGKSLTLIGYSSVWPKISRRQAIYIWVTIYLTTINRPPIVLHFSLAELRCGWSKIGKLWISLSAAKELCLMISHRNSFNICKRSKIPWWFKIKYVKKNNIVIYQSTIAANESTQVYLKIIEIRPILITHCSNIDCSKVIHNKQAPSCTSNCWNIIG